MKARKEILESGLRYAYRIRSKCNIEGEIKRMEEELKELIR